MIREIPKTLGRYEIQEEIGRGSMGVVYLAVDPALGRTVALKTIHSAYAVAAADETAFERRFLAEARVAAVLSHPGIVVVHDLGRDAESGTLFIAFEYLEGRTLAELTQDGTPMDWREALRITARVAEALHHAHSQGVIHRDIKPANVMVLASGDPKIMDFGIAKIPAAQLTGAGEFFGTPCYMSPEQALGETLDARSDLFSLAVVLYLLLTGRRAFDGPSVPTIMSRVTTFDPPAPSTLMPAIPRDVDRIIAKALAKTPSDRYPDGRSLADDIEDVLAERRPRHSSGVKLTETSASARADGSLAARLSSGRIKTLLEETEDLPKRGTLRRLVGGLGERMGRRGVLALGTLVMVGLTIGWLLIRSQGGAPSRASGSPSAGSSASATTSVPAPAKAQLEVVFEHSSRSGTIRVFVDDQKVLEEPLRARVVKTIGPVKLRKATFRKLLEVSAGEHTVRVEVRDGEFTGSDRIRGEFSRGATRKLEVDKSGILHINESLSLRWL